MPVIRIDLRNMAQYLPFLLALEEEEEAKKHASLHVCVRVLPVSAHFICTFQIHLASVGFDFPPPCLVTAL